MMIGAKMATQPDESRKKPKTGPKKHSFSKIPQDFELLKRVPESSHQTGNFDPRQYIGTLILS